MKGAAREVTEDVKPATYTRNAALDLDYRYLVESRVGSRGGVTGNTEITNLVFA